LPFAIAISLATDYAIHSHACWLLPPPVIVATSPFAAKAATARVDVVGRHPTTGQGRKSSTNASLGVSLGGAPTTYSSGGPIDFEVRIESKFVSIATAWP
jgi:hypothetical protein